jgi:hypothetical protein
MICRRVDGVRGLALAGARIARIDAERPLEDVIRSVKREIWSVL